MSDPLKLRQAKALLSELVDSIREENKAEHDRLVQEVDMALAAKDRLSAKLNDLRKRFDKLNHECDDYMEDNKRLDAENKRLREALERCREMVGHPDNIAFIDAALKEKS